MNSPRCTPFEPSQRYKIAMFRSLRFDGEELVIEVQGRDFEYARITFDNVIGFRVLDERDLLEFWNTYSKPNGWFYEVHEGGWFDLESKRNQFNCVDYGPRLREYFLVDYKCISVLAMEIPIIEDLGYDPSRNK